MDSVGGEAQSANSDLLEETMEEAWAIKLILLALSRKLIHLGIMEVGDLASLVEDAASMVSSNPTLDAQEAALVARMRGRLEAIGLSLCTPAGQPFPRLT